jgi:murein DD-endopeptidase MepM/ murein hydrolase activator NlpD
LEIDIESDFVELTNLKFTLRIILLCLFILLGSQIPVHAQDEGLSGPIYIVQSGDTLWGIAQVFNVSLDDLVELNGISDPSNLSIGTQLVIPGLEGLQGTLLIVSVPFGENFLSLSRRLQIPYDQMARLNRLTTPEAVAAGSPLIILERDGEENRFSGGRAEIRNGMSLLELAISQNSSPWMFADENGILGVRDSLPGDILYFSDSTDTGPGALPPEIEEIELVPNPVIQGKTAVFKITSPVDLTLQGTLIDKELHFFPDDQGYVAIQGVHAMIEPGYYPSTLSIRLADGSLFNFSQEIYLQDGGYPFDPPLVVNSETIDIENTQPEDMEWFSIVEPVTPDKLWNDVFSAPVPDYLKECYPSGFGNRRSYNGSAYQYFHTGLDFCGTTGVEIYAPAPGKIVFTGDLIVRGSATLIDHGWGVYTAYAHQSEILVEVGDWVEKGQLIGRVGETGRVTGPHLHWEVIVSGVQVDPLDWLNTLYP